MVCHSLLQWTTLCQNSPPWPIHLGWPYTAWLIISLSQTTLWSMWSVWLVSCHSGFHSVCPLRSKDKRIMEASWWKTAWGGNWVLFWWAGPCSVQFSSVQFSSVQLFSRVQLFATPWTAACQASLSFTNSRSWVKLMACKYVTKFFSNLFTIYFREKKSLKM